jgi:hypothetical protein
VIRYISRRRSKIPAGPVVVPPTPAGSYYIQPIPGVNYYLSPDGYKYKQP